MGFTDLWCSCLTQHPMGKIGQHRLLWSNQWVLPFIENNLLYDFCVSLEAVLKMLWFCHKNQNQNLLKCCCKYNLYCFPCLSGLQLIFPFQTKISSLSRDLFRCLWKEKLDSRQGLGKEHGGSERLVRPPPGEVWIKLHDLGWSMLERFGAP